MRSSARWYGWWAVLLVGGLLASGLVVRSQEPRTIEVFYTRSSDTLASGLTRLLFVDAVTGDVRTADVSGEGFTVVGRYVMYRDPGTGVIYRTWEDGRTEQHPFIQPAPETRRIDWVVSPSHDWIAWTLTNQVTGGLQTITTLARADGTEPRAILTDGPDAFMRAVPVALTDDWLFFFDRQPQGVGDYFFYRQYASLYRLDAGAEAPEPALLPYEPNCFCGAGLSPDGQHLARLEQVTETGGYDVRLWDLPANVDVFARSLNVNYQVAGAVLVSPDGRRVVYSLANDLAVDSAGSGRERFMLALMEARTGQQRQVVYNQLLVPLLPAAWLEDSSGVILLNPRQDGTWKVTFETGEIRQVSAATRVGLLH